MKKLIKFLEPDEFVANQLCIDGFTDRIILDYKYYRSYQNELVESGKTNLTAIIEELAKSPPDQVEELLLHLNLYTLLAIGKICEELIFNQSEKIKEDGQYDFGNAVDRILNRKLHEVRAAVARFSILEANVKRSMERRCLVTLDELFKLAEAYKVVKNYEETICIAKLMILKEMFGSSILIGRFEQQVARMRGVLERLKRIGLEKAVKANESVYEDALIELTVKTKREIGKVKRDFGRDINQLKEFLAAIDCKLGFLESDRISEMINLQLEELPPLLED